jgi:hypothetical protein
VPILEFEASSAKGPAPKKPLKLVLGAGVLVGALALGSTFAANINLNTDNNVEFGQGVVTTTACDDDGITVTPFSTFINATGGGEHRLSSIRLSGIDSSDGACEGKTFRIRAYGATGPALDLFQWETGVWNGMTYDWTVTDDPYDYVDITRTATDFLWTSGGTDNDDVINIDDQRNQTDLEQTAFTLNLVSVPNEIRRTPLASAGAVKKITVETFDASQLYSVGDTGPGGGIVFYVNANGFNCGPDFNDTGSPTSRKCNYLEAAPNTWSGGDQDPEAVFCNVNNFITTSVELGAGYKNTLAMLAGCSSGAANLVATYNASNGGGKSDWFLASRDEFAELYKARAAVEGWQVGGPDGGLYWTSTQAGSDIANCFYIYYPELYAASQFKYIPEYVRPIRAF